MGPVPGAVGRQTYGPGRGAVLTLVTCVRRPVAAALPVVEDGVVRTYGRRKTAGAAGAKVLGAVGATRVRPARAFSRVL